MLSPVATVDPGQVVEQLKSLPSLINWHAVESGAAAFLGVGLVSVVVQRIQRGKRLGIVPEAAEVTHLTWDWLDRILKRLHLEKLSGFKSDLFLTSIIFVTVVFAASKVGVLSHPLISSGLGAVAVLGTWLTRKDSRGRVLVFETGVLADSTFLPYSDLGIEVENGKVVFVHKHMRVSIRKEVMIRIEKLIPDHELMMKWYAKNRRLEK